MTEQLSFTNHVFIGPSPESRAAALKVYGITGALRLAVFDCIARYTSGRTDLEIQENLQMDGSTERPRRRELEKAGLIERNGEKRGGSAVWVLTDAGKQAAGR